MTQKEELITLQINQTFAPTMEIDYSIHQNTPIFFEEDETQETSMVIITTTTGSDSPQSPTRPSVSHFKIPSFFRKRFDYCSNNNNTIDDKESPGEIDKKKWLIEVASMFYKIFGGGKFSACRIGSKIDVEDEDSSSESEAGGEDYRDERETTELNDGSETEKKFGRDEKKISSQTSRIFEMFSKRNSINFNFDFNFIKSRFWKSKNGNRKQMRENSSAISYCEDDGKEEELWQKRILMGEKCKPLMNTSVSLR